MSSQQAVSTPRAYAIMHVCVLLWGVTAILGALISLPALVLVAWRLSIVLLLLALWPATWRGLQAMRPALRWRAALAGVFVALHWWTFYASIKLSSASVTVACLATTPVFVSWLEPLIVRRPFARRELLLGVAAVPAVWLVMGGTPPSMNLGIAVGILSALLVAIFAALNKTLAREAPPFALTAVEFTAGLGILLLGLLILRPDHLWPTPQDWLWLIILSAGCTLAPFAMAFVALRTLSAWSAQLIVNLEPVYAIILAALLLGEGEALQPGFYAGVVMLLGLTYWASRGAGR
nr:DMT family transporter [Oceanococcus sp. HetDA_MAG_MS8]